MGIAIGTLPGVFEIGTRQPGCRGGSGATGAAWTLVSQPTLAGSLRSSHKSRLPGPVLDRSARRGRTIGALRPNLFSETAARSLGRLLLELAGEPVVVSRTMSKPRRSSSFVRISIQFLTN